MTRSRAGAELLHVDEAIVDEMSDESITHSVKCLPPLPSSLHQLQPPQKPELVAERGHREIQQVRQICYAELGVRQARPPICASVIAVRISAALPISLPTLMRRIATPSFPRKPMIDAAACGQGVATQEGARSACHLLGELHLVRGGSFAVLRPE